MEDGISLKQVGSRLARLRKRAGLTQAQAAEALGVTTETVSRLERGVQWTDFPTLRSLARLYSVDIPELLTVFGNGGDEQRGALIGDIVDMLRRQSTSDISTARDMLRVLFRRNHNHS